MKKPILIVMLLLLCFKINAQNLAIIDDADGFVNVRDGQNINAKIVGKLDTNAIFNVQESEKPGLSNWAKIYYPKGDRHSVEGYIHKSRLQFLSSFNTLSNLRYKGNTCTVKNDSVTVTVSSALFIPKNHVLKYHKATTYGEGNFWEKIDFKKIWGTDGELPDVAIIGLSMKINGEHINIPKSAFKDLYQPRFKSLQVYLAANNTFYIRMDNSDGAGSYTVIWVIKNGKLYNRFVEDLC